VGSQTPRVQNRYAGDVGDFMKLGLLRHLAASRADGGAGLRLGINWYLTSDEGHNADGKHIAYVRRENAQHHSLRACDADLMTRLTSVVGGARSVAALEESGATPAGAVVYRAMVHGSFSPGERKRWNARALEELADAQLVFADPDNGIRMTGGSNLHKYALVQELAEYARRGQSLVVYHHADRSEDVASQARRRVVELAQGTGQAPVGAVIARRGTVRFFLVTAAGGHHDRLSASLVGFASRWARHAEVVVADTGPDLSRRPEPAAATLSPAESAPTATPDAGFFAAGPQLGVPLDFAIAASFIATIPPGRWTSYGDVASVAGNELGAMAVGDWLRRHGDEVQNPHRVIESKGFVADGFAAAGPGIPADAAHARELLMREGVWFDADWRASPDQRVRAPLPPTSSGPTRQPGVEGAANWPASAEARPAILSLDPPIRGGESSEAEI
jgi:alkylated DNA nucleotide flippase Atl1